ncbi:MAG: class I SAM-dependent methyltransferase [Kangiellaceae bacterium]|jgi:2-polyprenyl-3-methyl-5-hydroxy-6-metoxy-1,4-benzoquinol methylase|nr:class I SAM-dependent methyltransferase [Kangiellaceae bacterium]
MTNLKDIAEQTVDIYQRNAEAWDQQRSKVLFEKHWLDRLLEVLPAQPSILDVGCGAGDPIADYLIKSGASVTGIDAASSMVDICKSRFSQYSWHTIDMRELSLNQAFDGIIAWDSFFHLTPTEQTAVLDRFIKHLKPGGAMLITIGDEAGEVLGAVNGETVYHSSLAPDEYKQRLINAGFGQVETKLVDLSCAEHSILFASDFRESY